MTSLRILIFSNDDEILQFVKDVLLDTGFDSILKRVEADVELVASLNAEGWDLVLIDAYLNGSTTPEEIITVLNDREQEVPYLVMYGMIRDMTALQLLQVSNINYVSKENIASLGLSIKKELTAAGDRMRERIDLEQATLLIIQAFGTALELRDHETRGHTLRVTKLAIQLARAVGYPRQGLLNLHWGALLHDIGKIGVPDNILLKEGALDDKERQIIRSHPGLAYNLLSPIPSLTKDINIPFCHHEKWDGTGYPRKLKGKAIPLEARIFSIVDVYDALTSDRPYRDAWKKARALDYINAERRFSFDPEIVPVFLDMMKVT